MASVQLLQHRCGDRQSIRHRRCQGLKLHEREGTSAAPNSPVTNVSGSVSTSQYIAEMAGSNPPDPQHKGGRLRLFSLIAATFFMVSGGPYDIEDTLGGA
jgi:hypothetical protein